MADGVVIRPEAANANYPALQSAFSQMQTLSATDNRGWIYWAEAHGFNRYECWHHARTGPGQTTLAYDLFLPWHRAYLTFFAAAARDFDPQAILPWWDWTSPASQATGIPAGFAAGNASLSTGPVPPIQGQPARRTQRNPGPPAQLPTQADVDHLIADVTDFRDFSDQLQGLHDGVHGWAGGDMGSIATSAFDPVFWAHHCMIDRIWYLWQLEHGVTNIPPEYLDLALFPGYTVKSVLDVRSLGYDYAVTSSAAGEDVPPGVDVGAAPQPAGDPVVVEEVDPVPNPQPPTTGPTYTSRPIDVSRLDDTAGRVDVELHGVDHAGPSYEGRVYVDNPDATADTGADDPSYAGSYHVFGHGGCLGDEGHCHVRPRRAYDPRPAHPLTRARKVVVTNDRGRAAIRAADHVTITIVPIVEPLPYPVDPELVADPVKLHYVQIVSYR